MRLVSFLFGALALGLVLAACGSSTSTYHASDGAFSVQYPNDWSVTVQHFATSPAPDVQFMDPNSTVRVSVRVEPNPKHRSAQYYILHKILGVKQYVSAEAGPQLHHLHLRSVKVDGASGVAYTTNVTSKLETILIPARGRMYLLFGFDSAGVQQLHDMLKSFKFA